MATKLTMSQRTVIACESHRGGQPAESGAHLMTDTVENLILDLVEWVRLKPRSYRETMEAWRTSCPRFPVWEDATERGYVEITSEGSDSYVRATPAGLAFLMERRPMLLAPCSAGHG